MISLRTSKPLHYSNRTETARRAAERRDPGYDSGSANDNSIHDNGSRLTAGIGSPGDQRAAAVIGSAGGASDFSTPDLCRPFGGSPRRLANSK